VTVEKLNNEKNQVILKTVDKDGKPFNPKTAIQTVYNQMVPF
jgi:hypothetical protein